MNAGWDRDNEDPGTTVVMTEAEPAALLFSGLVEFGETIEGYI
jgi:hypothetical protein